MKRVLVDVLWLIGCGLGWHLNDGIPRTEPAFIRKAHGFRKSRPDHRYFSQEST